jgi:hypothetical protein
VNRIVPALILFALAAYGAGLVRDGYRDGRMSAPLFDRINLLVFDRAQDPAFFWGLTVINLAIVVGMMLGGILLLVAGVNR